MDTASLRMDICNAITARHRDPAEWLPAVRDLVERLKLSPARCIPLGVTLDAVVFAVLTEARAQGHVTEEQVRSVLMKIIA